MFDRCHPLNDILKFEDVNETFSSRTVLCLSVAVGIFLIRTNLVWTDKIVSVFCPAKNRLYSSNVKHYFCYSEPYVSCAWNWTLNDCFCFRSFPFWLVIPCCNFFYFIFGQIKQSESKKGKSCLTQMMPKTATCKFCATNSTELSCQKCCIFAFSEENVSGERNFLSAVAYRLDREPSKNNLKLFF